MSLKSLCQNKNGQVLTSVIVFMAFGLSVIALSSVLTVINIQNTAKISQSAQALNYAEAGAEEAALRLIRDPAYSGGILLIETVSVSIAVSGDLENRTIQSSVNYNGFAKKIEVQASLANNKLTLISWKQTI